MIPGENFRDFFTCFLSSFTRNIFSYIRALYKKRFAILIAITDKNKLSILTFLPIKNAGT